MENFMLKIQLGSTLVVQWLRLHLHTSNAGGMGSVSDRETKILHASHG